MNPSRLLPLLLLGLVACKGTTMNTLVSNSDFTQDVLVIYERIFWWTTLLFVLVQGLLLWIVFRFKATGAEKGEPEQVHGNTQLELTWTVLPVFILLHIAIPTVATIFKSQAPAGPDALVINATGKQWWFAFEYPAQGFTTANELHVPEGQEVEVRLQSDNVMHAFWVPQLAAKRDMVPGRVNRIKFTATKQGLYLGQCAEFCSDSHALMRFRVVVDSKEEFARWSAAQAQPAATASAAGFQAFQGAGCTACHAISGTTAEANIGPNLSHVGSRTSIAAGILAHSDAFESGEIDPAKQRANFERWIKNAPSVKPGSKMPAFEQLPPEQLSAVVDYLISLK